MDTPRPERRVAALVALKPLPAAKSRLAGLPDGLRRRLARCMALDTVAALASATDEVLVITEQPDLSPALLACGISATVMPDPTPQLPPEQSATHQSAAEGEVSLNAALAYGDQLLRTQGIAVVLACVGDLPALRTESVRGILTSAAELAAGGHPRCYVADHSGRGTTILVANGVPLDPRFGSGQAVGSAERHRRSGAVPVTTTSVDDARWDVDTLADLRTVLDLGIGRVTASLLDPSPLAPATGALGRYLELSR